MSSLSAELAVAEIIIRNAKRFTGLYETVSNAEWDDPTTPGIDARARELRAALIASGLRPGDAYCMTFAKAIWSISYAEAAAPVALIAKIRTLLSPSVMNSFTACRAQGLITTRPVPGAIFFMRKGDSWSGHAGIVTAVGATSFSTAEGNTSPRPNTPEADREGDGVFEKERSLRISRTAGLWLCGFLNPL